LSRRAAPARNQGELGNLIKFMCCFSRPVISVSATNIFARAAEDGRQFLVYSMTLNAKDDLAMVLPLPVKIGETKRGPVH
jgi:hypothetical protein